MDKERSAQEGLRQLPSTSQASSTCFPPLGVDGERPSEVASADGSTLGNLESADGRPQERIDSNRHASSSPRCTFGWLLHLHELLEGKGLRSAPQSLKVSRSSLRHIVGKGGRMLRRIEDYTGSFISVSDCDEQQGTVRVWGGQGSLARVVILAISFGFTSALDTISRNGIMSLRDVECPPIG